MAFADTLKKWFGSAKETASEVTEKAGDVAEAAWDKTKDIAEDVKDRFDGDDEKEDETG